MYIYMYTHTYIGIVVQRSQRCDIIRTRLITKNPATDVLFYVYYNRRIANLPHYVSTWWGWAVDHSHEHNSTAKTLQTGAITSPHVLAAASAAGKPYRPLPVWLAIHCLHCLWLSRACLYGGNAGNVWPLVGLACMAIQASHTGRPYRQARLTQAWVKSEATNPVVSSQAGYTPLRSRRRCRWDRRWLLLSVF